MNSKVQAQWLLGTAAVLIVAEPAVGLLLGITAIRVSAVLVAALLALFLIRRSRIAWTLVTVGALAQVAGGVPNDEIPELIFAVVVLVSILAPPSIRSVWASPRNSPPASQPFSGGSKLPNRIAQLSYSGLARLTVLERDLTEPLTAPRSYGALVARLFTACLLCYVLYAYLLAWEGGSGQGNLVVEVLARMGLLAYLVAQAALLIVLVFQLRSYVIRRKGRTRQEA